MEGKDAKSVNAEGDDQHGAMSSSYTAERPGNFLFKIESFSLFRKTLTASNRDKFDSCPFKSQGYKWKLIVYPNGDKKRGGDGYISLYLALADPKSLPQGREVHVFFKFFVFDHLRDSYLVLQDGKDRRFHALKTEWGFAKLLPLEIFNDPSRGYLVEDRCAFGVEMFFHKKESKSGSTISIKSSLAPCEKTFTWTINNFSTLIVSQISKVFSAGGRQWYLKLWPRGSHQAKDKSVSLYLIILDKLLISSRWKIYADFKLRILDQLTRKHHEITEKGHLFSAVTGKRCAYPGFIQLWDLKSGSRGFIVHDTVVIQLEFMAIYSVNPRRT